MSRRKLSTNPATVERRDRRMMAELAKQEREFNREVSAKMAEGLSFGDAFIACGGIIIDDERLRNATRRR